MARRAIWRFCVYAARAIGNGGLTQPASAVFGNCVLDIALGSGHISGVMAMNLLGAIVGGLLEYNSMYLGFQALYLMAMVCYALAFVSQWIFVDKEAADTATPSRVP